MKARIKEKLSFPEYHNYLSCLHPILMSLAEYEDTDSPFTRMEKQIKKVEEIKNWNKRKNE